MVLRMSEDGTLIEQITEFVNSHYTPEFLQLVGQGVMLGAFKK